MIETINNYTFKSFKNYSGPNNGEKFKQKNLFFGYNGKGKTALSKGILTEIKKNNNVTNDNYRFFNKDFIKDNLLLENNVNLKRIIANFGKENVDIEKAIEEKLKGYKNISPLQEEKQELETNIKNEVNRIFDLKKGNSTIKRKTSESLKELVNLFKLVFKRTLTFLVITLYLKLLIAFIKLVFSSSSSGTLKSSIKKDLLSRELLVF